MRSAGCRPCTPLLFTTTILVQFGTDLEPEAVRWSTGVNELLIDCEEDRTLRAVLVGMLRDMERR